MGTTCAGKEERVTLHFSGLVTGIFNKMVALTPHIVSFSQLAVKVYAHAFKKSQSRELFAEIERYNSLLADVYPDLKKRPKVHLVRTQQSVSVNALIRKVTQGLHLPANILDAGPPRLFDTSVFESTNKV